LKLKGKLLTGASALALASGLIGVAAPAAHAAVTHAGDCDGTVAFDKIASATKGQGLGDQTAFVKVSGNIAKALLPAPPSTGPNAGNCSGVTRPGDPHVPNNNPLTTLTPISQAVALSGNATCAATPADQLVDATAADAYPLNGSITWKFSQTYFDPVAAVTKNYAMKAQVALLGIGQNGNGADVVDIGGIVLSGVNAGAAVSGNVWEDPVAKQPGKTRRATDVSTTNGSAVITSGVITGTSAKFAATDVGGTVTGNGIPDGTTIASVQSSTQATMSANATVTHAANDVVDLNGGSYSTGYALDLGPAIGCADGVANTANVLQVLSSGGGNIFTSTSLLGSSTTGLSFDFGEA
jgi:hypothetical protein